MTKLKKGVKFGHPNEVWSLLFALLCVAGYRALRDFLSRYRPVRGFVFYRPEIRDYETVS